MGVIDDKTTTPTSLPPSPIHHSLPILPQPPQQETMLDPKTDLSNTHVRRNERWGNMNLDDRVRKTAQNYENYRNYAGGGGVQLGAEDAEDESGVSSPPLWKNNYRYLSPNSRSQAIARGQSELMEMVKTMPESCYELSLRDIVEKYPIKVESEQDCLVDEKTLGRKTGMGSKRQDSKKNESSKSKTVRSRSFESGGGLLLKMAFPFSLGPKKKQNLAANSFSRVSPKPEGLDRSAKGVEKEWWRKRFSGSSESERGGTRGSSGSSSSGGSSRSSSRKKSGCSAGCWSFLTKRNKKTSK